METTSPPVRNLPHEAALIVNVHSRRGEALFKDAKARLEEAGLRLIAAHAVKEPERLQETVRRAIADGAPMVIVGGGDGSLSGTVDELVGKDCVFGVLPLGTANSFARTLGIPLDLEGAVAVISGGRRRRIDLGMIDRDYFVNAASLGLSPRIGETVPHKLKRYLGRIGYLLWAVKCSIGFRAFRLMLDDGIRQRSMWATEVRILNGPYHGGVELSDQADVDTGEIVIQAVVGRSHARLAWDWYAKFFKLRDRDAQTEEFRGKAFRIETAPPQSISIDGEVLAKTPAMVKIAAGAVDVAVP
ncbi:MULTISPECIES: diacylglycerol kinase family protein [Sphingobium]|jgi:YegS/Rv2252/BmrU family lipid kinase|uniref:Diacylglycerol kinase n=2 Tax=Sphingobium fuliginis (strain ATCC 27551) TaxID=336203 RepID=A0A292ZGU5_SPHSA|nr:MULTISPECIES: diacylglycerol kinase family protein [Sphingobium]OAP32691.1 diacylglycerol kinase [Sphingobium sp. 20006FA]AJR22443.1 diacylglycerol kinase [Sphingobium sp. YBL2]KXU31583.1 diacylglycerol kinase [Sphingobium sp. AM]KYC33509.1 diacylglycerol kinase [Sphingobium sp. 22B]PNQ02307.1 diacylglycerol kinase [Sphingobium sp. SA916]